MDIRPLLAHARALCGRDGASAVLSVQSALMHLDFTNNLQTIVACEDCKEFDVSVAIWH